MFNMEVLNGGGRGLTQKVNEWLLAYGLGLNIYYDPIYLEMYKSFIIWGRIDEIKKLLSLNVYKEYIASSIVIDKI